MCKYSTDELVPVAAAVAQMDVGTPAGGMPICLVVRLVSLT
jgi:hypothetical protein